MSIKVGTKVTARLKLSGMSGATTGYIELSGTVVREISGGYVIREHGDAPTFAGGEFSAPYDAVESVEPVKVECAHCGSGYAHYTLNGVKVCQFCNEKHTAVCVQCSVTLDTAYGPQGGTVHRTAHEHFKATGHETLSGYTNTWGEYTIRGRCF